MAKALLAVRETDEAAAAAWDDRMGAGPGRGTSRYARALAITGETEDGFCLSSSHHLRRHPPYLNARDHAARVPALSHPIEPF